MDWQLHNEQIGNVIFGCLLDLFSAVVATNAAASLLILMHSFYADITAAALIRPVSEVSLGLSVPVFLKFRPHELPRPVSQIQTMLNL